MGQLWLEYGMDVTAQFCADLFGIIPVWYILPGDFGSILRVSLCGVFNCRFTSDADRSCRFL